MKTKLLVVLKYLVAACVLALPVACQTASADTVMDFGDVLLGTTAEMTFTYTLSSGFTQGDAIHSPQWFFGTERALTGSITPVPSDFAINPSSFPEFFGPFTVDLFFTPSALGEQSATLTVQADILGQLWIGGIIGSNPPATCLSFCALDVERIDFTNTFTVTGNGVVPLPSALPLFATGLGAIGLLGWRRKRKAQAI